MARLWCHPYMQNQSGKSSSSNILNAEPYELEPLLENFPWQVWQLFKKNPHIKCNYSTGWGIFLSDGRVSTTLDPFKCQRSALSVFHDPQRPRIIAIKKDHQCYYLIEELNLFPWAHKLRNWHRPLSGYQTGKIKRVMSSKCTPSSQAWSILSTPYV